MAISLETPAVLSLLLKELYRKTKEQPTDSLAVKAIGEPDAGNPHVRFDERGSGNGVTPNRTEAARQNLYHEPPGGYNHRGWTKCLRFLIINVAGRIVRHARKTRLRLATEKARIMLWIEGLKLLPITN